MVPKVIGSTVKISIPSAEVYDLVAKVDTGADGSSIWASNIKEKDAKLNFCLLGPSSPKYTPKVISTSDFQKIRVHNSFGSNETRYKVGILIEIEGRKVRAKFTLANRQAKSYPALIGRRLLHGRFIVDVSRK